MRQTVRYCVICAAAVFGGGGLLVFGLFLFGVPLRAASMGFGPLGAVAWNAGISLIFFGQHSGMIRPAARRRLTAWMPEAWFGACYSIAAGIALLMVVLLWQPLPQVVYQVPSPVSWLIRAAFFGAGIGFIWSVSALEEFDGLGIRQAMGRTAAPRAPTSGLTVSGPYRWVRHPLYFLSLVMIWAAPVVSADRFQFNLMWSLWIVVGAHLEEQDLRRRFGRGYEDYRRQVPMLFPRPWRRHGQ